MRRKSLFESDDSKLPSTPTALDRALTNAAGSAKGGFSALTMEEIANVAGELGKWLAGPWSKWAKANLSSGDASKFVHHITQLQDALESVEDHLGDLTSTVSDWIAGDL